MNLGDEAELSFVDLLIDRIPVTGNHKINKFERIGQSPLPQTVGIIGPDPRPMVALINYLPQRKFGLLEDADMITDIHEVPRIGR